MVKLRQNVTFLADFVGDTREREEDDYTQFAGKNVATTLADRLTARGYDVEAPENFYELGWEFSVERDHASFAIRVTDVGQEFVLVTRELTSRLWPGRKPYAAFMQDIAAFLQAIHSILSEDPRFSRIWWFDREMPRTEDEGFANPVDA